MNKSLVKVRNFLKDFRYARPILWFPELETTETLEYLGLLKCPNCEREVPNKEFFVTGGCKWCCQDSTHTI